MRRPRSRARLVGVEHTWQRIRDGSPVWLVAAIGLEAASFVGYIWLLRAVASPLAWWDALTITLVSCWAAGAPD